MTRLRCFRIVFWKVAELCFGQGKVPQCLENVRSDHPPLTFLILQRVDDLEMLYYRDTGWVRALSREGRKKWRLLQKERAEFCITITKSANPMQGRHNDHFYNQTRYMEESLFPCTSFDSKSLRFVLFPYSAASTLLPPLRAGKKVRVGVPAPAAAHVSTPNKTCAAWASECGMQTYTTRGSTPRGTDKRARENIIQWAKNARGCRWNSSSY